MLLTPRSRFVTKCHQLVIEDGGVEREVSLISTYFYFLIFVQVSAGGSAVVMKYGFPSLANIKTRESYITSYDPRTRTASWVIERLNPASLSGPSDRKHCDFKEDDR